MKVSEHIMNKLKRERLHFTLIDPDKQSIEESKELAVNAKSAGTDAFMIGGSTSSRSMRELDEIVKGIKASTHLPVILFPASASALSRYADAVFFMSMLNSKNVRFLSREQMKGARFIKESGIEPISMGYIIIEPGMKVGEIGEAECISRESIDDAVKYALTAEYFGMKFVYLEAGSGAPSPPPVEMIRAVKDHISIPLIVGGGIRSKKFAKAVVRAGADIVVTGTLIEQSSDVESELTEIIRTVKSI